MKRIDLNVDCGEGFGTEEAAFAVATSANVCCGEHAGSWEETIRCATLAQAHGLRVGAHPGFPDREHMGRRSPPPELEAAWYDSVVAQVRRFVRELPLAYVKPHGAWYGLICQGDPRAVSALDEAMEGLSVPLLLLLPGAGAGRNALREGFADRGYGPDGLLIPRGQPGALLEDLDEVRSQVLRLAPSVDSICAHGDGPSAVPILKAAREALLEAGYVVTWKA